MSWIRGSCQRERWFGEEAPVLRTHLLPSPGEERHLFSRCVPWPFWPLKLRLNNSKTTPHLWTLYTGSCLKECKEAPTQNSLNSTNLEPRICSRNVSQRENRILFWWAYSLTRTPFILCCWAIGSVGVFFQNSQQRCTNCNHRSLCPAIMQYDFKRK